MRFGIPSPRSTAIFLMFSWTMGSHAATFTTFIDDQPGFLSAIGSGTIATNEDFSSSVNLKPIGSAGNPDIWNGFTVEAYGPNTGTEWSPSKYCQALNSGSGASDFSQECLFWNTKAPAVPGIYAAVNLDNGISFKLANSAIAAFSFDFVDWNDIFERSNLRIFASDGTSTIVSDSTNIFDAPPQKFGVTLSPADIAAGIYIKEIRWMGIDALGEVVGFYNFQTYTNPKILNNLPIANPDRYSIPNSPTILNILANDTDVDSDTLQIIGINGNPVNRGTPVNILVPGGSIEVSAVGEIKFTPSANATDPISFQYEISDGRGGTAKSNVTLTNVIPPEPTIAAVPAMGEIALIALSSIIAFFSIFLRRKAK